MSREPEQSDDPTAASDEVLEEDDLRAFVVRSISLERLALEKKYGPDVRLLAEDDDKLLTYLESEDLSLKRVALLCLLHFHTVHPKKMVRVATDYLLNGVDIDIRSLCVTYLGRSRTEDVTSILQDCALKLRTRDARPGDDVVLKHVARTLESIFGEPKPFNYWVGVAEEILARLNSEIERNDSAGQATGSRSAESDQDKGEENAP